MNPTVLLNGEWVSRSDASISVYDGGWLHGAGLFETMRAENGRVFRLRNHLDRLCASAERLLAPLDRGDLPDVEDVQGILDRNGLKSARLRLTVSSGDVSAGAIPDARRLTIALTAAPLTPYPEAYYQSGVSVIISPYRQSPSDPLAGHKSTCYLPRLLALQAASSVDCLEALWFTTENRLAEGSISNIFVVKDSRIRTPPLETPVLPGIARGCVLELCDEDGVEVRQDPIHVDDLLDADEVFLTNTIMQVMPVRAVERRAIGDGRPGPLTADLRRKFHQCVARECGIND
jgi:branched-chain amino acid aminotransferase